MFDFIHQKILERNFNVLSGQVKQWDALTDWLEKNKEVVTDINRPML
jgi:hypothetical protein